MRVIIVFLFIISIFVATPRGVASFSEKETFPKIANYYLQPFIPKAEYTALSKYDLVIIDIDAVVINPDILKDLRRRNPEIKLLMYVPSQSVNVEDLSWWAEHRRATYNKVESEDWWLKDSQGNNISFSSTWPTIKFVDPGKGWNEYLSDLVAAEIKSNPEWDGVFYDMVFANLRWLNGGDIDLNRDRRKDSASTVNTYWQREMSELMSLTKQKIGSKQLVNNVDIVRYYNDHANGGMFENFPATWLGSNSWSILVDEYLYKLPHKNQAPKTYVINTNTDNNGDQYEYQKMRFGLTTTLLGEGYSSFDFGDTAHNQVWWYDEYNVELGVAESKAYNLLDRDDGLIKKGLWRRDFENGVSIVNSSEQQQTYVFYHEEFEKINGTQDRAVNDGQKINYIRLAPKDGVVLLKINNDILDTSFNNGSFVRVFSPDGSRKRNGFFSYKDAFSGNTQILVSDIDNDQKNEILVNGGGQISVYDNGKKVTSFRPYDGKFRGEVSFAVSDLNGDSTKEIITGAGRGGGPHVRVFDKNGKPLIGGFFAYDKNFRGGVDIAVMDLNGDSTKEIVTGAGLGGGSHVRVFSKDGNPLIGGFFAYNNNFRGGVSVAAGDVDGDGQKEIITGAGPGGGPHVKIFDKDGVLKNHFFAYAAGVTRGIRVMSDDIDNDNLDEILVSLVE